MRRSVSTWLPAVGLFLFLVVELVVFDRAVSKNYAWMYPRWNDQVQYLTEAYSYHELAKSQGLWAGLSAAALKPSAQGMAHAPAAVALFALVGPSRSAALFLNVLALAAFQFLLYLALSRQFSRSVGWIGVGLSLLWFTIVSGAPGSAVDFRLDFLGSCTMGIALAVLLLSKGLGSMRWAAAFGAATALALLTRFLMGTYFVVIYAGLFIWILSGEDRARRLRGLALAALMAALIAGPFFWYNRSWIYEYYYIGHYVGPESAIRNQGMGILGSLRFLWSALVDNHLRTWFWAVVGAVAIVAAFLRARRPSEVLPKQKRFWFSPALLFLLGPLLILTLHSQKSHVVVGVFVPACVALGAGLIGAAGNLEAWRSRAGQMVAALVVALGFGYFTTNIVRPAYTDDVRTDARRVNTIADFIYTVSRNEKLDTPRIAVDVVTDTLDAQIMRVICYERKKQWVPFVMTLPTGIAKNEPDVLRHQLRSSDFAFIAVEDPIAPMYPYDAQMREMRAENLEWCRANMTLVDAFPLGGRRWELYGRVAQK